LIVANDLFEMVNGFRNDYWGWGGEDDEFYYNLMRFNVTIDLPPHSFDTDSSNTFLDLHDSERSRDKERCKGQQLNTSKERSPNCGLKSIQYTIDKVQELEMNGSPFTMVDVKLVCDFDKTPYCKC
jgi:xylosylprotein 4-beta-galactosyltransferase